MATPAKHQTEDTGEKIYLHLLSVCTYIVKQNMLLFFTACASLIKRLQKKTLKISPHFQNMLLNIGLIWLISVYLEGLIVKIKFNLSFTR
jgi:hypothetical protein